MGCEPQGTEQHSIAELLDDPIARLLMKSYGINRCTLQLELAQIARVRAGGHVAKPRQ
jgi:hypothetical protein